MFLQNDANKNGGPLKFVIRAVETFHIQHKKTLYQILFFLADVSVCFVHMEKVYFWFPFD